MSTMGIIGFGKFGQLWASIFAQDFPIVVYDCDTGDARSERDLSGISRVPLEEVFRADTVFYCVPMSSFESAICSHLSILARADHHPLIADVLSVKTHPQKVMEKYLPTGQEALLTHPMFGPDGVAESGLKGQRFVIDKFRASNRHYKFWLDYLQGKGLAVIEMTAEEHDRLAAASQGLVHFIGRTLARFGFVSTPIDTLNARKLQEITQSVNRDTWQLFEDLQTLNPYMSDVWQRLEQAEKSVLLDLHKHAVSEQS